MVKSKKKRAALRVSRPKTSTKQRQVPSDFPIRSIGKSIRQIIETMESDQRTLRAVLNSNATENEKLDVDLRHEKKIGRSIDRMYKLFNLLIPKPAADQVEFGIKVFALRHSCIPEDGDSHSLLTVSLCDDFDRLVQNGWRLEKSSKPAKDTSNNRPK